MEKIDMNVTQSLIDGPKKVWRLSDIFGMLFAGLFALMIGGALILLAFGGDELAAGEMPELTLGIAFAFIALEIVAFGFGVGIVGLVRRIDWGAAAWLRPMTGRWWLYSFLLGVLIIPVVGATSLATQELLNIELESNPQLDVILPEGFSWLGIIGMTMMIGVLVPFVEELFFRGVLFTWLLSKRSYIVSALISSVVFGLFHVEPYLITGTAVLGLLAAWAMHKSGSIWAAVVIHGVNNGLQVILVYSYTYFDLPLT